MITGKGWKTKFTKVFVHRATRGPIALLKKVLHKVTVKGWKIKYATLLTQGATDSIAGKGVTQGYSEGVEY